MSASSTRSPSPEPAVLPGQIPRMNLTTAARTLPPAVSLESVDAEEDDRGEVDRLKHENQKLWAIMDKSYAKSACESAGLLDKRKEAIFEAMQRADLSSVLFTSTPFASAMSKWPFQLLVVLCSCWFFGSIVFHTYNLYSMDWTSTSRLFIFSPTELRDGTGIRDGTEGDLIVAPNIKAFGLLRDGCKVDMHRSYTTIKRREMIVIFKEPIKINGWYLVTGDNDPQLDPTHFALRASVEQDSETDPSSTPSPPPPSDSDDSNSDSSSAPPSSASSASSASSSMPTTQTTSIQTDDRTVTTPPPPSMTMNDMAKMHNSTMEVMEDGMGSTMVNMSVFEDENAAAMGWDINLQEFGHWKQVGASQVAFDFYSRVRFLDECTLIPEERGVEVFYDMRPSWESYLNGPVRHTVNFIMFTITAILAVKGHSKLSRWPFIAEFLILFVLCIPIASVYVQRALVKISFIWWAEAVGNLILPLTMLVKEEVLVSAMLVYGFYYLAFMPFVVVAIAGFSYVDGLWICVPGALVAAAAIVFQVARNRQLKRSQEVIAPDKRLYDETWSCLVAEDQHSGQLTRLEALCTEIQLSNGDGKARQFQRKTQSSEFNRGSHRRMSAFSLHCDHGGIGIPDSIDYDRPVSSLDQLYIQATAMDLVLKQKVKEWARDGFFPAIKQTGASPGSPALSSSSNPLETLSRLSIDSLGRPITPVFVKWEAAKRDDALKNSIKWASIKSSERAIEKSVRTYRNDVSRLLDVVRQSIVFNTVDHITNALRGILQDPEVRIVRVKNRLDKSYDSWQTAGYRDLVVNLRIVSSETMRLGVETHVCELQLIHVRFAEMKHDEGHKRYVQFRNLRGQ